MKRRQGLLGIEDLSWPRVGRAEPAQKSRAVLGRGDDDRGFAAREAGAEIFGDRFGERALSW